MGLKPFKERLQILLDDLMARISSVRGMTIVSASSVVIIGVPVFLFVVSFWPSSFPESPSVSAMENHYQGEENQAPPVGYYTTTALIETTKRIVNKRGGFLSNDILPPFILMDNIPSWEMGALRQSRDLALTMRNDITRAQSQSEEEPHLAEAQVLLNNDASRWIWPSAEGRFNKAIVELRAYKRDLLDSSTQQGDFYARADNLVPALELMSKRLGSLSQRLSASVYENRTNTDLGNSPTGESAKRKAPIVHVQTPWLQTDNVFYEARGATWAMTTYLKAFQRDFDSVLEDKNANVSMDQIIRELEYSQADMASPVVLNGSKFGFFPNYSLAMSSYLTRANAGIIDIINLLEDG